jgi:N-acetylmuramoyl-L-alanine amidase
MSFPFTQDLSKRQRNISKGTNTCEYIVLHHTWSVWSWNIPVLLGETWSKVSCHFLVRQDGTTYKLGDPKWILWHCGTSQWDGKIHMNRYCLGIEVEWPKFTSVQRTKVKELTQHLMAVYNVPKSKVIRHKDIAPWRKTDIDDSFFRLTTFWLWRWSLTPKRYE